MIVVLVTTAGRNKAGGFLVFFSIHRLFLWQIGFFMYFCNYEKTYSYFGGWIAHNGFLRL